MANLSGKFESHNQEWETPDDLFFKINSIYKFNRDICASSDNSKCDKYWSEENSCLDKKWDGVNWMNPPFNKVSVFLQKAYDERETAVTVCLVPARTNTKWWHCLCMKGEVHLICGRPKFKNCKHGLPQPLALVVFGAGAPGTVHSFYL